MSLIRYIVVTADGKVGTMFRDGVCLGRVTNWHLGNWGNPSMGWPVPFSVATIPALEGESVFATLARVRAALGRPSVRKARRAEQGRKVA